MTRTFIEVPLFTKRWKEIGLHDEELLALQIMLLKNPESGIRPRNGGDWWYSKSTISVGGQRKKRKRSRMLHRFRGVRSYLSNHGI